MRDDPTDPFARYFEPRVYPRNRALYVYSALLLEKSTDWLQLNCGAASPWEGYFSFSSFSAIAYQE
jgi:hypothetical protein